jgi:shikimate dehydrogenase
VRFAVVGDPIDHSRSPAIHRAAYTALGIDASYTRLTVPEGGFGGVVSDLRSGALDGVNVTMPHKSAAHAAAEVRSEDATRTAAVNTIVHRGGLLMGYNTDVAGVIHAVSALDLDPTTPVLVLGAGGAARAATVALARGRRRVTVSARRDRRAIDLLRTTASRADVVPWGTPVPEVIVVNATPIGMHGEELPPGVIDVAAGLVDMAYGPITTPAVRLARRAGLPTSDGISMLVGQAAEAFSIFVGVPAPLDVMIAAARGSVADG